jgi:acyl-coenzyme A thioesterase 9
MEITVWLEQFAHGHWEKMTRALFLMAARNSTNDSPAFINSLVPENEKEKEVLLGGESKNTNLILQKSRKINLVFNGLSTFRFMMAS